MLVSRFCNIFAREFFIIRKTSIYAGIGRHRESVNKDSTTRFFMNKGLFSILLRLMLCLLAFCFIMPVSAYAQTEADGGSKVSGTVIDATGWPIIGAAVLIKGTTIGSSTDLDGHFEFDLPSDMGGHLN